MLNNPLKYTDLTGRYTVDEIQQFLQENYADNWQLYWNAWQADPYWMSILFAAQDGYLLDVPSMGVAVQFLEKQGSFEIGGDKPLHNYQGQGVYALFDLNRVPVDGLMLPYLETTGLVGHGRSGIAYEPIYDYSSGIPSFTDQWLRVEVASTAEWNTFGAGDATPWWVAFSAQMVKKFGKGAIAEFAPVVGQVATVYALLTTLDDFAEYTANIWTTSVVPDEPRPYGWHLNPNGWYPSANPYEGWPY